MSAPDPTSIRDDLIETGRLELLDDDRTIEAIANENHGTLHERASTIVWRARFARRASRSAGRRDAWADGLVVMNRKQRRAAARRQNKRANE